MSRDTENTGVDNFLTVGEAAQLLGMTYKTTHRHVMKGNLKGTKKGGRYLIPRSSLENFQRSLAGRPRTSVPQWRFSPEGNRLIATSVEAELRAGIPPEHFEEVLERVKRSGSHLFEGTVARYILSDEQQPRRVQFLFFWRETVMPEQASIARSLADLGKALDEVLAWETAHHSTHQVWMHT